MNSLVKGLAVGTMLLVAVPAFAASNISNIKFDNGQVQTSCTAGQVVNVTFRVIVPAGEVAELGQVDVIGDTLAPALPTSLGGELGLQEGAHDVTASVTCPQNTGYYNVEYRTAGIFLGQRAIAITDGVVSVNSFGNALRVVDTNTGSTVGGSDNTPSWLAALMAAIANLAPKTPPTPTTSASCTAYAAANAGTMMNVKNDANVRLQGFLLSQGASIPALAAGASFGFFGPQTQSAVSWFQAANHCN